MAVNGLATDEALQESLASEMGSSNRLYLLHLSLVAFYRLEFTMVWMAPVVWLVGDGCLVTDSFITSLPPH